MRRKRGNYVAGKHKPSGDKSGLRATCAKWAGNALAAVFGVGMLFGWFGVFVWQPIDSAMMVYAIQNHPVMATQSAVVTEITQGKGHFTRVRYTTNTGENVSTKMCRGVFQYCASFDLRPGDDYKPGSTVKVKYVSYDPYQVYPSDYEAGYGASIILFGSVPLLTTTLIAWSCWSNRAERRANRAAKKRQAPS